MAIETVMLESFDGYDVVGNDLDIQGKWTTVNYSGPSTNPRTGNNCLGMSVGTTGGGWYVHKDLVDDYRMLIVGFALKMDVLWDGTASPESNHFLRLLAGTYLANDLTTQLTLSMNSSGYLQVYRGTPGSGTLLQTSTTTQLTTGTWYYIEFKAFIDDTGGAYEVEVDGVAEMSGSSVDTQAHATKDFISSLRFHIFDYATNPSTTYVRFDDIYIRGDKTTNTAGGLLGPVKIYGLLPNANGNHRQWTRSTGTDDYTLIDEAGVSKTDYLSDSTDGNRLSCGFENLPADKTVEAVQCTANMEITSKGGRSFIPLFRSGGVTYTETAADVNEYGQITVYDTNPAGGGWTKSAVDNGEFGVETD